MFNVCWTSNTQPALTEKELKNEIDEHEKLKKKYTPSNSLESYVKRYLKYEIYNVRMSKHDNT